MKYQCGHSACDLCGGSRRREPNAGALQEIDKLLVCTPCIKRAIRFTYDVACKFGGWTIDVTKPCARPPKRESVLARFADCNSF